MANQEFARAIVKLHPKANQEELNAELHVELTKLFTDYVGADAEVVKAKVPSAMADLLFELVFVKGMNPDTAKEQATQRFQQFLMGMKGGVLNA